MGSKPVEEFVRRSSIHDHDGGVEGECRQCRGRWSTVEDDVSSFERQPTLGRLWCRVVDDIARRRLAKSPPQEWWCNEGGDEDDDEDRPVQLVVEGADTETDRCEDEAHFASREHAEADHPLVARRSECSEGRQQFADDRKDRQQERDRQYSTVEHRRDIRADADVEEEHRNEDLTERRQVAFDSLVDGDASQPEACDKCSDDRCEICHVGEHGEGEHEGNGDDWDGGTRPRHRTDSSQQDWECSQTDDTGDDEETDGEPDRGRHRRNVDRTLLDDAGDDGEDDESEHVVGHRRPEDGAGLGCGQRA